MLSIDHPHHLIIEPLGQANDHDLDEVREALFDRNGLFGGTDGPENFLTDIQKIIWCNYLYFLTQVVAFLDLGNNAMDDDRVRFYADALKNNTV